ncbi:MAG: hypothetical protein CMM16_00470 [Rhodospirillaceae bacterium]|nr:hypothetical protein [Rhodospirillaceae bacterium]|tara:strand:- start:313 stop:501 length:189 start_codon:yes stop_codon:yes gene_type:complete
MIKLANYSPGFGTKVLPIAAGRQSSGCTEEAQPKPEGAASRWFGTVPLYPQAKPNQIKFLTE